MGEFKPLLELDGQTMLERCIRLFSRPQIERIVVVSGHRALDVDEEATRLGAAVVHNPLFDQGMFSSVRTAVDAMGDVDAFFLLPVDIALVRPAVITVLIEHFDGRVAFPCFQGERGHPPLIPAKHIPAIQGHDGQGGLKAVLHALPGHDVPVWDRGILLDADTPDAFAELQAKAVRICIGEREEARVLADIAMPARGVAHGQAVARVAGLIARALNAHGLQLDLDLVHNAALLHDIAKGERGHEARGAELLAGFGLSGLAGIVAAHRDVPPPSSGMMTEKEVVCLADKLVRGPFRVPVRQRFEEKLQVYANDSAACQAITGRMVHALGLQALVEQTTGLDIECIVTDDV